MYMYSFVSRFVNTDLPFLHSCVLHTQLTSKWMITKVTKSLMHKSLISLCL